MAKLRRITVIFLVTVRDAWRLTASPHERYKPEKHYLRGRPGPKWKAKHAASLQVRDGLYPRFTASVERR